MDTASTPNPAHIFDAIAITAAATAATAASALVAIRYVSRKSYAEGLADGARGRRQQLRKNGGHLRAVD